MVKKFISIILMCIFFLFIYMCNSVYGKKFDTEPYTNRISSDTSTDYKQVTTIGRTIIRGLRGIGVLASVAVLIVIGIKYMLGSVEEKAKYKETFLPYIIGAIMVFAITVILSIIIEVTKQI